MQFQILPSQPGQYSSSKPIFLTQDFSLSCQSQGMETLQIYSEASSVAKPGHSFDLRFDICNRIGTDGVMVKKYSSVDVSI